MWRERWREKNVSLSPAKARGGCGQARARLWSKHARAATCDAKGRALVREEERARARAGPGKEAVFERPPNAALWAFCGAFPRG